MILSIYKKLLLAFGRQDWWPARSPFEVMVGAVLTQNTNWNNVEKAIDNLRSTKNLSIKAIDQLSHDQLAQLIKPAGYFNVKAKRLKNLVAYLVSEYDGKIEKMKQRSMAELREELLAVNGIGPETADSILLYALDKPTFVVDAYTKRFLYRHNLIKFDAQYAQVQELFHASLKKEVKLFNEYHALIVELGKLYCRPKPKCEECPLKKCSYNFNRRCDVCFRAFLKHDWKGMIGNKNVCIDCQE